MNRWYAAGSVAELGELTADWLEGSGSPPPGYLSNEPDDETRDLIPALSTACRAGYVTTQSQPGHRAEIGWNGRIFEQRAAVEGWASSLRVIESLRRESRKAGMTFLAYRPGVRSGEGIPVTRMNGDACTWFGRTSGHRKQIAYKWPGLSGWVARELRTSTFLILVDPQWGRNDLLWNVINRSI